MKLKLFLIAVLFFCVNFTYSQNSTGSITGTVVDKSAKTPIESADVTLYNSKDTALVKGTSTDKEGKFSFENIPYGSYYIKANIVGYSFATVRGIILSS
ncbi:MAG TPA: carboxypeptidase-like regulatory domain-containing protein, partial [Ignavibacteria bacterium]